jgi:hypothetical protein
MLVINKMKGNKVNQVNWRVDVLGFRFMTGALFAAVASTGVLLTAYAYAIDEDVNLHADLERISQRRIFFGHNSVGENLLEGITRLSTIAGVPVHIAETKMASSVTAAMIGQTIIAENGFPFKKLKSFEQAIGQKQTGLDIAFMKFCFVDFTSDIDVKALFANYQATIKKLQEKNPGTIFVHVTAPLTTVSRGFKAQIKYFFGYSPLYGTLENMRREEYNNLLRQAYQGNEPIFDLAHVESTAADGKVETVKWNGSVVPVMLPVYTNDGGHLNAIGQLRAARELVSVLAGIPKRH